MTLIATFCSAKYSKVALASLRIGFQEECSLEVEPLPTFPEILLNTFRTPISDSLDLYNVPLQIDTFHNCLKIISGAPRIYVASGKVTLLNFSTDENEV